MSKNSYPDSWPETEPEQDPAPIPFPELLNALLDVETPFPTRYLYRLTDLEPAEISDLKKVWSQIPSSQRRSLMEDMAQLGQANALLSFKEIGVLGIADEEPEVRRPAARILRESDDEDLLPILSRLLDADPDVEVRSLAAAALGKFVYLGELEELPAGKLWQVEERLLQAAGEGEDPLVRRRALESLGFSNREEVAGLIEHALGVGRRDWTSSALTAMGRSADIRWSPQVLELMAGDVASLRAEAARAAGELELADARPLLMEMLADPDDDVRLASIWSLSQIGGEEVRPALEALYEQTEDEEEAEFIEEALDNLSFTEETLLYSLFDFPDGEEGDDTDSDALFDLEDEILDSLDGDGDDDDEDDDDDDDVDEDLVG